MAASLQATMTAMTTRTAPTSRPYHTHTHKKETEETKDVLLEVRRHTHHTELTLVLAHIAAHHALNLPRAQQNAQAKVVDPAVVAHHGQILGALFVECRNQVLGDAAQAEAADQQLRSVANVLDRLLGRHHRRKAATASLAQTKRNPSQHRFN